MRVIIKTKGGELEQKVRDYATEKFVKLSKLIEEPAVCEVMIYDINGPKGGEDKFVELVLTMANEKNPIHVETNSIDFLASINFAHDCLEKQLVKHKEKYKIGDRFPKKYFDKSNKDIR